MYVLPLRKPGLSKTPGSTGMLVGGAGVCGLPVGGAPVGGACVGAWVEGAPTPHAARRSGRPMRRNRVLPFMGRKTRRTPVWVPVGTNNRFVGHNRVLVKSLVAAVAAQPR